METTLPTGRILVHSTPDGGAPLELQKALVGLTLPCEPTVCIIELEGGYSARYFLVPYMLIIKALSAVNPPLAMDWYAHWDEENQVHFVINEKFASILNNSVEEPRVLAHC